MIGEGAYVRDSIIMNGARIGSGSELEKAIVAENAVIGNNVRMGVGEEKPNETAPTIYTAGIVTVGDGAVVPDNVVIGKNVMINGTTVYGDYPGGTLDSGRTLDKGGEAQ